jgi:hypothetical protein
MITTTTEETAIAIIMEFERPPPLLLDEFCFTTVVFV